MTTIGANAFCDTVLATVYVSKGDTARVKALVEGTGYTAAVTYVEPGDEEPKPSIAGDDSATVTGDAESGYVVTPRVQRAIYAGKPQIDGTCELRIYWHICILR